MVARGDLLAGAGFQVHLGGRLAPGAWPGDRQRPAVRVGGMLLAVTIAGTSGVPPRDAGSASGLLTTARQLGGALGLAVLTSIAGFATRSAGDTDPVGAAPHGYRVAFVWNAGIMVAAVVAALLLPREAKR